MTSEQRYMLAGALVGLMGAFFSPSGSNLIQTIAGVLFGAAIGYGAARLRKKMRP